MFSNWTSEHWTVEHFLAIFVITFGWVQQQSNSKPTQKWLKKWATCQSCIQKSSTTCGGFQFLPILDLCGISFHAVVVFGLGKNLLFKSVLGHCGLLHWQNSDRKSIKKPIKDRTQQNEIWLAQITFLWVINNFFCRSFVKRVDGSGILEALK